MFLDPELCPTPPTPESVGPFLKEIADKNRLYIEMNGDMYLGLGLGFGRGVGVGVVSSNNLVTPLSLRHYLLSP